ncbi:MAG: type II secretion system protein [Phycisphaeraceae bacterium]
MLRPNDPPRGFTLIELLVVISIIALLMAILLPVLGAARRDAQLIQSLSNLRQIGTASTAYSAEYKGDVPIDVVTNRNGGAGWCTWSFGGKFASDYWARHYNGLFDIAPSSRPLNDYLYPGQLHPPVSGYVGQNGFTRPGNESERTGLELPVFQSPRDIATMQRGYPNITPGVSCYDDIGNSYHYNVKWYDQIRGEMRRAGQRGGLSGALNIAKGYMKKQHRMQTSRFVLYNDQVLDAIKSGFNNRGLSVVDGEFGLENHSAMVFFDGHASFEEVVPGATSGDNYDLGFDE